MTDPYSNRTSNPIIALWVHPRSMSTAIERIMRERGDLQCLHEPFMYYYYIGLGKKQLPHADLDIGRLIDFMEIIADMRQKAHAGPLFFKDMGYYVQPEIYNHPELAREIRHLVLVRDPRKSILSYHRLDPQVTREEIGIEAQWTLYQWLTEHGERPPHVIIAEQVQQDPFSVITRAWEYLGLSTIKEAFAWDAGGVPDDWQSVTGWHKDVISSHGIRPTSGEDDAAITRQFEKAVAREPRLAALLEHHWPFYEKLLAVSGSREGFQ
jgi:hypothetical protein